MLIFFFFQPCIYQIQCILQELGSHIATPRDDPSTSPAHKGTRCYVSDYSFSFSLISRRNIFFFAFFSDGI